jgi:(3S)-malyl-CoA thioesterase
VAPDEKAAARELLSEMLAEGGYGRRMRIVRINGLGTDWGHADAEAAAAMDCDAVLVPKVDGPPTWRRCAAILGDRPSGR